MYVCIYNYQKNTSELVWNPKYESNFLKTQISLTTVHSSYLIVL